MSKLKLFSVIWYDKGNCEIAEVRIKAHTIPGAFAPAYHGLTQKQYEAVQKEAVSVKVEEFE